MSNDTGYVHASHVKQVVSASSKSGTAIAVLLAAVSPFYVDFKKPETTFTKDDMCELLNAGRRAIAIALKELRDEGSLVPIKHFGGGKGHAVTYRLCIAGQGVNKIGKHGEGAEGMTPEEARERRFRSLARKFGAVPALEMMKDE